MLANCQTPFDPRSGAPHFELQELGANSLYSHWQQLPTYSVLWIQQGAGSFDSALSNSTFDVQTLLFFAANQPFRLCFEPSSEVRGVALHFGANFYDMEKHQAEAACERLLFNVRSEPVAVQVGTEDEATFASVVAILRNETQQPGLAQHEMLASCLKILLIRASRLLREQSGEMLPDTPDQIPAVLLQLEQLIERYYHQKHTPADYADLLHLSPKALGKLTRIHFQRTLTELIQGRIVVEAKRKLYLTNKSVKEIAFALGFNDQYYFSRFFKHTTSFAPLQYRRASVVKPQVLLSCL